MTQNEFNFDAPPPPSLTAEERKAIIEKIKKLLRMKHGGTIAEVETALRLAQDLAAKYGIDLAGVNPDEQGDGARMPIGHEHAFDGARIHWECKYAGLIAQQFFNVSVFTQQTAWKRHAFTFVGTDWDREIAIYVYRFLVGAFRRAWKTRRGRCRNRQMFMYGMYIGLCSKLSERLPPAGVGLIRIERSLALRKDYIANNFGKMESNGVKPDGNAANAKWAGYQAGRDTDIRPGLTNTNEQGQRLIA